MDKYIHMIFILIIINSDLTLSRRHASLEHGPSAHAHFHSGEHSSHELSSHEHIHNIGHLHPHGHHPASHGRLNEHLFFFQTLNHNSHNNNNNNNNGEIQNPRPTNRPQINGFDKWKENWWKNQMEVCGQQKIEPRFQLAKIMGGHNAVKGSWPWMISLFNNLLRQPTCAAVLISDQWALTAGHCFSGVFNNESLITARIGIHNSSAFSEDRNEQAFKIIKVILNTKPHLKMVPFDNDIALLKFHQPVAYSSSVKPICLPSNKEIDKTVCAITGWGRYREPKKLPDPDAWPEILQQTRVPVLPDDLCRSNYKGKITENMFCAGYERGGVDACQGDSGGPLQCKEGGRWIMRGITSWGGKTYRECAQALQPGVYTKVYNYVDWILQQIYAN